MLFRSDSDPSMTFAASGRNAGSAGSGSTAVGERTTAGGGRTSTNCMTPASEFPSQKSSGKSFRVGFSASSGSKEEEDEQSIRRLRKKSSSLRLLA